MFYLLCRPFFSQVGCASTQVLEIYGTLTYLGNLSTYKNTNTNQVHQAAYTKVFLLCEEGGDCQLLFCKIRLFIIQIKLVTAILFVLIYIVYNIKNTMVLARNVF